jgi:AcrR family transcriptional regulator
MPKGKLLTPEQQEQRREDIAAIALRLFDEAGFQKTSMREIAEAANMGKSSLYDFFKTKDEIIVYAAERVIAAGTENAKKIAAGEPSSEMALRKIMDAHLEFTKKNKSVFMWLNAEGGYLNEEYQNRLQVVRHAYRDVVRSVIEAGVASGTFRDTDAALLARLLVNSMLSIAYTTQPSSSLENMLEETIRIFLRGIMA